MLHTWLPCQVAPLRLNADPAEEELSAGSCRGEKMCLVSMILATVNQPECLYTFPDPHAA